MKSKKLGFCKIENNENKKPNQIIIQVLIVFLIQQKNREDQKVGFWEFNCNKKLKNMKH